MKLSKSTISKLEPPAKGYALHWDDTLPGFGVRITSSGAISFIVQQRIHGKDKRITLGRFGKLTYEQARKQAINTMAEIHQGGDPVATKTRRRLESATLGEVLDDYLTARKTLKPLTVKDMRQAFNESFSDWLKKPILKISRDMVAKRHRERGKVSQARADLAMRYLRAVFNFAAAEYTDASGRPIVSDNPVKRLSETRAWYKVARRNTVIKPNQLAPWFKAVQALERPTPRDYLTLVLLTGLRKTEALQLRWEDVDFVEKTLTVKDTKNHQDHTLPLSDHLYSLLLERHQNRTDLQRKSPYVFPAHDGKSHYQGPTNALRTVRKETGITFTLHDLRRTFATVAESLDIPAYALKKLLNHKTGADVTAGYIVMDNERLRIPMQKITNHILTLANQSKPQGVDRS